MANTSNWSWVSANRVLDVNITSGGVRQTRNNWQFIRSRVSDDEYISQLGEQQISVSAYAGGSMISESVGEIVGLSFGTTTNWTDSSYTYLTDQSFNWVGSGGNPQYPYELLLSSYTNKPNSSKTTIVRPVLTQSGRSWLWKWEVGEWDIGDTGWETSYTRGKALEYLDGGGAIFSNITVSTGAEIQKITATVITADLSGYTVQIESSVDGVIVPERAAPFSYSANGISFIINNSSGSAATAKSGFVVADVPSNTIPTNRGETATSSGGTNPIPTDPPSIDGETVSNFYGTFSGSSTASVDTSGGTTGILYCSSDEKSYTGSVPWYKQTQTWIFKDEYQ